MKGKLVPVAVDGTVYRYTDANDQDWKLAVDLTKGNLAASLEGTPNMYGKQAGEVLVRSDTFAHAGEGIDGWVDDWNAGQNPGPRLTVNATNGGGNMWPLLLLAAAFLLLDDKGKRR